MTDPTKTLTAAIDARLRHNIQAFNDLNTQAKRLYANTTPNLTAVITTEGKDRGLVHLELDGDVLCTIGRDTITTNPTGRADEFLAGLDINRVGDWEATRGRHEAPVSTF